MTRARLTLYDTTLRDGAQTTGVDFSLDDKRHIAALLDALGLDYIEGGYPGANPLDTEFFAEKPPLKHARFAAFGMIRRTGRSAANDPGLAALLQADADAICFVAKAWDFHVHVALQTTLEDNLDGIARSIETARAKNRETMLDCEHFFDGYKANPSYALEVAKTAYRSGARWVVLCDTNGGTLPHEVERIVGEVAKHIPGENLGIHAHNDTENAVANSLAAVRAGVRQIQGTLNGLGERCGNANLVSIIPTLKLKAEFADKFDIGVSKDALSHLARASHTLDDLLNRSADRHAPYVGESAFATKAGIHASAIMKEPATYEHVTPESVGNKRRLLVSDQAGRSNLLAELDRIGLVVEKDDPRLARLLDQVKEHEAIGYAYEAADASFELLARRLLGKVPRYFDVEKFDVNVEHRLNAKGERVT
ncbi:MAG: citramalate synthase, partial [Methylovirgula sp.]